MSCILPTLTCVFSLLPMFSPLPKSTAPPPKLTKEAFQRLKLGMQQEDVEAVLGKPKARWKSGFITASTYWGWEFGDILIAVRFADVLKFALFVDQGVTPQMMLWLEDVVCEETARKIKSGMSVKDVEAILGRPTYRETPTCSRWLGRLHCECWAGDKGMVIVDFENDRVGGVQYFDIKRPQDWPKDMLTQPTQKNAPGVIVRGRLH